MPDDERPIGTESEKPAPKVENPASEETQATEETATEKTSEQEPEFKGQFSSQEEAEKAFQNAQALMGRQGTELGQTREQLNTAIEQLNSAKSDKTDFGKEVETLKKQVRDSEIDLDEMVPKIVDLAVGQSAEVMNERLDSRLDERDAQDLANKFMEENPDFAELRENGTLDRIIQGPKGAFASDYKGAYFMYKQAESQDNIAKLQAEVEAAKQEGIQEGQAETARVAKGAAGASSVLSESGQPLRDTAPKVRTTRREEEDGAHEALARMRAAS